MKIEEIEIHTGAADFPYTPVRQLEASCEAPTAFSKTPTIEDVNFKLRQLAASIGANAVIDVRYRSGPNLTSWRSVKATGLAVSRVPEDRPCPVCAETIKRAAKKCRFCGAEVSEETAPPVSATMESARIEAEPLRSSDNLQGIVIAVVIGVFMLLALMAI